MSSFEISVRRKVPVLTALFFKCSLVFAFLLLIGYLIFLPSKNASGEMQLAYVNLIVPPYITKIFGLSLVGFFVSFILWAKVRLHKKAILTFYPESINLNGNKFHVDILVTHIRKVTLFDPTDRSGIRKGKFKISIESDQKKIRILLKDYDSSDEFIEALLQYPSLYIEGMDNEPILLNGTEEDDEY